jgi:hypothetical protein
VIPIAIVVAALLVLLLGPRWYQRRRAREAARMKDLLQSVGTITQTRQKILTREFLANMPPGTPGIPRFVVMDWDTGGGMLTLVAADDGAVSAYFDFGSAIIGAGTHAQVRTAAVAFREEAKRLLPHFSPVQRYTVPDRSHAVIFYVVMDTATLSSGELDAGDTRPPSDPFAELQRRAQALLAEVRLVSEAQRGADRRPPPR